MNEIQELETKKQILNNEISILADAQIRLSKDIETLTPQINSLRKEYQALTSALKETSERIAQKEAERNEELNRRDTDLSSAIKKNAEDSLMLEESRCELNSRQESLNQIKKEIDAQRILNEEQASHNEIVRITLQEKEDKLYNLSESFSSDEKRLKALSDFLEDREEVVDKSAHDLDNAIYEQTKREEALDALNNLLIQKQEKISIYEREILNTHLDLEKEKAELVSRENKIYEDKKTNEGLLQIIDEEKKKIQLAWLKINKANQDRQLDIDIKDLQK